MHAEKLRFSRCGAAAGLWLALFSLAPTAEAQTTYHTLEVGGQTRSYYLHVPPSYTGKEPVPLVLVLHGWAGNGRAIEQTSGFSTRSDQAGFLVVYPNAMNFPAAWQYGWGSSNGDPQEEIDFFTLLLDELEHEYFLDTDRVYLAGISDGGNLAHFLGSVLSDRLAGIAVVGGAAGSYKYGDLLEAPWPENPVSVLIIHGWLDRLVPYEGGPWGSFLIPMVSVAHSTAFWVYANDCNPEPATDVSDDGLILAHTFADGAAGTVVRVYTIVDGRHEWFRRPGFDTTDVIWNFFAGRVRR